jgi:hypothetical protein
MKKIALPINEIQNIPNILEELKTCGIDAVQTSAYEITISVAEDMAAESLVRLGMTIKWIELL